MEVAERVKAKSLRRQGLAYREILEQVPISRSTLSVWLRDMELTMAQQERIHGKNMQIRRRFVEYARQKREAAIAQHELWKAEAAAEVATLPSDALKWMGAALYWAEGTKAGPGNKVRFSNSDPRMIHLIMRWFRDVCAVSESKFRASVQIHDDQNLEEIHRFWLDLTEIPRAQFTKPAVRIASSSKRKQVSVLPLWDSAY